MNIHSRMKVANAWANFQLHNYQSFVHPSTVTGLILHTRHMTKYMYIPDPHGAVKEWVGPGDKAILFAS